MLTCDTCAKTFVYQAAMDNHVCAYFCEVCCLSFHNRQGYQRHVNTKKHKKRANGDDTCELNINVDNYIHDGVCVVCEHTFASDVKKCVMMRHCASHNISESVALNLKRMRDSSPSVVKIQNTTNNNTTHNTTNNIMNNIVIFGNEDFSYIKKDALLEALQTKDAIPKLCQLMRNNPHHPENRNVKVTDIARKKVKIFTEDGWKPANPVDTFNNMIMESSDMLDKHTQSGVDNDYGYYHEKIDAITDKAHELDMAKDKGEDTGWGKECRNDIMLQFVE